ncbi:MAG: ROK family protein [Armatimonadetes bacterium]|nr:ROK family protein [Armatimonadota bacterium]
MHAQARQAGPGLDREDCLPISVEAAGPANPRLILEEVTFRLGGELVEAQTMLSLAGRCFCGTAHGRAKQHEMWQLAAAASVAAMQHYLQHNASDPTTPQIFLLDTATHTTGIGQEYVTAIVRAAHDGTYTDLIGSALVRNDRSRTAVAAALDATSRFLGRFRAAHTISAACDWTEQCRVCTAAPCDEAPPVSCSDAHDGEDPIETELPYVQEEATCATRVPPMVSERMPPGFPALGVAISGSLVEAALVDAEGCVLAESRRSLRAGAAPELALSLVGQALREVISKLNGHVPKPKCIGVAIPGRVSETEGICLSSGQFPTWRNVPLAVPLAGEFDLPVSPICATQAEAFAEFCFGAAQGIPNVLYVRVGLDIDAALVRAGLPAPLSQLVSGQVGHMVIDADGPPCTCGDKGCWQTLAGREALIARVVQGIRSGAPSAVAASVDGQFGSITPSLVVRMAGAGDVVARRALDETGRHFALGLANLIALLGPQAVIVESQPSSLGSALLRAAEKALKSSPRSGLLSSCVLLMPELGESAPMLGAAAWAARNAS